MKEKRFLFLDPFRSLCALVVLLTHSYLNLNFRDETYLLDAFFQSVQHFGQTFGVNGFFLLSSFLLTYRLLSELFELDPANKTIKSILIIAKYFTRRFFRVYVPAVGFLCIQKISNHLICDYTSHRNFTFYPNTTNTWLDVITLANAHKSHLWTIPVELFYYFWIPIVCLPCLFQYKRTSLLFIIFLLIVTHVSWNLNEFHAKFNLSNGTFYVFMKVCLPVLLEGSLMAAVYFYLQEFAEYSFNRFSYLNNFCCIVLVLVGMRLNERMAVIGKSFFQIPSLIWMLVLFLMSVSQENLIRVYMLEKNWILMRLATYSYGLYLWHPISIDLVNLLNDKFRIKIIFYFDMLLVEILVCLLFSYFFYVFVEKKSINLGHRICRAIDAQIHRINATN